MDREAIARRYERVRARTVALASRLSAEDSLVQSMPDASPTKWHLSHTTWFFEEIVLARFEPSHRRYEPRWRPLYNSYYEALGPRHSRGARGLISRPSLTEVHAWRTYVDERMAALLRVAPTEGLAAALLGTHHEEQHQELLLTDAKHALSCNPLLPAYASAPALPTIEGGEAPRAATWTLYDERLASLGHDGGSFAFDNEGPRHRAFVGTFWLASRLVTNAELTRFVDDRGYERPELWLADGWSANLAGGWRAPLYWQDDGRSVFTLHGVRPLVAEAPAVHVSFYEADAYARWAGARLPTEEEWEVAATGHPVAGNFLESGRLAPEPARAGLEHPGQTQLFGDAWEWTASAYLPYPRFRPLEGVLGEYNGKFMSGQMVLRGGSCLSPLDHLRATYRNFFPPQARWQMTGVRLARDA